MLRIYISRKEYAEWHRVKQTSFLKDSIMIVFDSAKLYIESATTIRDRIDKIQLIIDALFTSALESAANAGIQQYSLNDGQTVISEGYKDPASVMNAIRIYEQMKKHYIRQLNGDGMVRLVDGKNFRSGNGYGR
ncbi:MAG: hypothetical protein H7282_05035 [Cytophagaceae bacterium]|nr:hypothetical protein [Cytophagaceae bacterium]